MCGIAGFFGQRKPTAEAIADIVDALRGRGPDASGQVAWNQDFEPVSADTASSNSFIHTRLRVRDLSQQADQPMFSEDGQVCLCYNGEVYDWEQYIPELEAKGYKFRTHSDSEFILHAWHAWGMDMLPRLRGMFAIGLLDLRSRQLYLIRDRLGIKPLLYFYQDGELAFSSLLRGVLPYLSENEKKVSPSAIDAYLAHRYVPAPMTILEQVKRLPAAHMASFGLDDRRLEVRCYWQPDEQAKADEFEDLVKQSVAMRLVSDRPVGLFLSGGIDSSVLASCLKEMQAENITAYTAQFPGSAFDESEQAAKIAASAGMEHQAIPVIPDPQADFEVFIRDMDEPFADPSALPLWTLSRATVAHAPVVLGGDGGDELLAGYKRYAKHKGKAWRGRFRLPWRRKSSGQMPGRNDKIWDELHMSWAESYSLRFSGMYPAMRRWLQPDMDDLPATYWQIPEQLPEQPIQAMLELDRLNYLPEYILRKSDLCTASHGLEARVPMLDHHLFSSAQKLPPERRFTQPSKMALSPVCSLCNELDLFNQPKRGFNPPIADWLNGPLAAYLDGLAEALQGVTQGQIAAQRSAQLISAFQAGESRLAEQVLQLLVLNTSLKQIQAYGKDRLH